MLRWLLRIVVFLFVIVALVVAGGLLYFYWPRTYRAAKGRTVAVDVSAKVEAGKFDWPQFRGPRRDGTSSETGWSPSWRGAPKQLWRGEVGRGASGMSVSGGRLFTVGNRDGTDVVWCLAATSGRELWRFEYECPLDRRQFEGGPAATPTVEGDRLWTLSQDGQLFCLDVTSGTMVWAVHVATGLGGVRPFWGYSGSVLVAGEKLIADIGGSAGSTVALDKQTGRLLWRAGDDKAGYSSPVLLDSGGEPVALVFKGTSLVAHAIGDGRVLWRHPWETSYDVNASMPIASGSKVFISSGYGHGCALLETAGGPPRVLWDSDSMCTHFGSCILRDGRIYGIEDKGRLRCLDLETGAVRWERGGFGKGTLILVGDTFVILSEGGEVVTADARAESYVEIARARVLTRRCWVSPAFADGLLYVKDNEGNLACLDLRS